MVSFALLGALAAPAVGCVAYVRPRAGVVYFTEHPPVARVEVVPASPGVGFVWIKGYWGYHGNSYAWVPGRWERPAEGHRVWVAERWQHDRNGWYLVEGHWR
jgi:hypothetical protein